MKILSLALILQIALCLLKVTTPVVNALTNNQIPYNLANFGDIPYGVTLKGNLHMDQQYPDLCSPIKPLNDSNTILLAWRGECSFVKKVINGQKAGAKMVIISDNIVEDSSHITMGDNGSGRNVHIPSIFINEMNGQILQKQLQHSNVSLSMRFEIKQTDRVNVSLFLSLRDRHSAVFVREIHSSIQLFGDAIHLDVSYYTAACGGCDPVECFTSNDYCIITGNRTGGATINSQVMQYGVFLLDKHKWFQVYNQYDQKCYGTAELNCLQEIMREQKVDQKKIQATYSRQGYPMQQWTAKSSLMGVTSYPSVSVNGIKYMGSIDSEDVVEMICASLNSPPEGPCGQFGYWTYGSNNGNSLAVALWVTMIVVVVILMIVGGVFVYRKTVKKQITNEMSLKVTQMVTQYIKLSSEQERQSRNKEIQKSRDDL